VINISPFLNIYQNKIFQQIMPSLDIRLIHWLMGRMFTTITLMKIWSTLLVSQMLLLFFNVENHVRKLVLLEMSVHFYHFLQQY